MDWDWSFFLEPTYQDDSVIPVWEKFLMAWGTTFEIAAISWIAALAIGMFIGILRTLPHEKKASYKALYLFATCWVELFRNIPILVQMFLWLYVIPTLIPFLTPLKQSPFILALLALAIFTSTRVAEQVRAGIQSIPKGIRYASLALGLNAPQTYIYVLLPITVRTIMPPLISESMNIVKNSSVAFALGVYELLSFTNEFGSLREDVLMQIFLFVTIAYSVTALSFSLVMRIIERRLRVPGFVTGSTKGGR